MAFTAQHYTDLKQLLTEHPEWRRELRQLILPDDFETLPEIVRRLAEAHERAEGRLTRLEEAVAQLVEAQQRTEEKVAQLAEAQQRTEERLARLEEVVQKLVEAVHRLDNTTAGLKGGLLELRYANKAHAYWGFLMRRLKVTPVNALEDQLEAALTSGEFRDVFRLDVLASGRPRERPDLPDIWLAVEVSSVVDVNDVDRAARRAGLLRKAGYRALPVAAGEGVTLGGARAAREQHVVLTQDGQIENWEEALDAWAAPS